MDELSHDTVLAPTLASTDGLGRDPAPAATAAATTTAVIRGQSIGRYLLLEALGAGAMGIVYAA